MSEYEAYWLMAFQLIIYIEIHVIMVISQKKQTNKYKENFVIYNR